MNGLALMRAIDWRTSSSRSPNASAAHSGLMPVSSWIERLKSSSREREHAAVGVVDEDDLLGAEQPLRDRQRADLVVGDDAAGVADHVRVALAQAEQRRRGQPRVHARDARRPSSPAAAGRSPLSKLRGVGLVVGDQLVGDAHGGFLPGGPGDRKVVNPTRFWRQRRPATMSWPMERVRLERLSEDHIGEFSALVTDAEVLRFTRVPEPPPADFPRGWLDRYVAAREDGSAEAFAAVDPDGRFVGLALAPEIDREAGEVELGYIVHPAARGRGVATEMLRLPDALGVRRGGSASDRARHRRRERGVRAGRRALRVHARGRRALDPPQAGHPDRRGDLVAAAV